MRFALPAFGFMVAAAFWPMLLDAVTAPRWAVMAIGAPLLLLALRDNASPLRGFGYVILAGAALTVTWSSAPLVGIDYLAHLVILGGVFLLGASLSDLRPIWAGAAAGVAVSAVVAVAQVLGWITLPEISPAAPAGFFYNKNLLAEAGVVALIAVISSGQWKWAPTSFIAAVLPMSWNAIGALAVVAAVFIGARRRAAGILVLLLVLLAVAITYAWGEAHPMSAVWWKIHSRVDLWASVLEHSTWFGNGLGSFWGDFGGAEHAHNDFIQITYELGLFAVPIIAVLIFALRGNHGTEQLILTAVLAMACLSFPLCMPFTAFAAALAAGHLVRGRVLVRSMQFDRPIYFGFSH